MFRSLVGALLIGHGVAREIKIDVLYETNCPYSQKYIVEEIGPLLEEGCVADHVDFHWVPFGMGTKADDGTINCQHGPEECIGNRVQLCAKTELGETDKLTKFIVCMETNLQANGGMASDTSSYDSCATDAGIDAAKLASCAQEQESLTLADQMGDETLSHQPTLAPWVIFDGVEYNLFGTSLKDDVCAQLSDTGVAAPACCSAAATGRRLGQSEVNLI
jgi:interferon gamma-inducible protein 30